MTFIILVIAALLILSFPTLRCAVSHPLKLVRYGVVDLYQYVKYQKWNECSTGELIAYVGLFGKGKTLSAVHKVVSMYKQYAADVGRAAGQGAVQRGLVYPL